MFNGSPSVCPIVQRALQVACAAALLATAMQSGFAAIPISTSAAYTQNFDGIGSASTAVLPADFRVDKAATLRTVGTFGAALTATSFVGGANLSTGAANGIYNFGSGTTTTGSDRAVGFVSSASGTQSGNLYVQLVNNTGAPLTGLQLSYSVEKYRMGINPAAFRIQLFYSLDGATWISAGDLFQTSFPADGGTLNSGFTPAPGTTVTVSNQNLSVAIPDGSNFYLAWNYSVASGSTTSNAQALAIDDISILGLSNTSTATNPTATGAANPNTVQAGNSTLLAVAVTPGANPVSTGLAVRADLSSIGGSPAQQFFDDGTHGDLTPGDNVFSLLATLPISTSAGPKSLTLSITDAQSRSAAATISLNVTPPPTPPAGVTAANPSTVQAGNSTLLAVAVTPGANPVSTGLTVRADLSSIGGSPSQQFFDDGTHGDLTPGDNVFSFQATVATSTAAGAKGVPVSITDAQSRSGTAAISLNVTLSSTAPIGMPAANPRSLSTGASALLTVTVTPGTNPASTGIGVSGDLTAIGGSPAQQFFDDGTHGDIAAGDNIFSFAATVGAATVPGTKSLPVTVSDAQGRSSLTAISLTVQSQSLPSAVKISQAYGGGGNSGSTYKNDFIELFNQATTPIDVSTWSVQFASAGQSNWTVTPLCASAPCVIEPGRYFLVQELLGTGGTTNLPTPDATGTTNLAATSGQVALVTNTTALTGTCLPTGGAIMDFVGYGKSGCPNAMPSALSNTTAAIRKGNGCIDTDNDQNDFLVDEPIPRNSSAPANSCASDPAKDSGFGMASPDGVQPTAMTLLTVAVTPATTPPSTNLVVTADLSALGGSSSQQFFDDGTHGDKTAGDNTFSVLTTIGAAIPTGAKYLVGHVTDSQGRSADVPITMTVASPTCGVEYWNVKTGTDADALAINLNNVISTTISDLRAIPMPFPPLGARPTVNEAATRVAPTEFTVFQIYGTLTQYKLETDVDYHLVLQDESNNTIIGEVPSPACVGPQSPFLAGVMNSRTKMDARLSPTSGFKDANLPIQVTGVGFFDNIHGQTGVAPNGIELHAILDLNFTTQSNTLLTPGSNPAQSGQTVTFTATVNNGGVSTPTGNVTFRDGTSTLAVVPLDAGRAAFTTSALTTGPHTITASYGGDGKSAPSTSAPLVQMVN
jgi:hypothetical protein